MFENQWRRCCTPKRRGPSYPGWLVSVNQSSAEDTPAFRGHVGRTPKRSRCWPAAISHFDSADLVASAGGLQLLPDNAEHIVRFEALAPAAASLKLPIIKSVRLGHRIC